MIFTKQRLGFRVIRILYQGENLSDVISRYRPDYCTVVAYEHVPLEPLGFRVTEKNIANIYLDGDIAAVFGRFTVSTRNEINRTLRDPDFVFRTPDTDVAASYRLYCEFEKQHGRVPWKRDSFTSVLAFNAYWQGELVSTIPVYDLGNVLKVRAMASARGTAHASKERYKAVSHASRRLVYELCRYGVAHGHRFVGLGEVTTTTEQKANVAQFKLFFGARVEREYTHTFGSRRFRTLIKWRDRVKHLFHG